MPTTGDTLLLFVTPITAVESDKLDWLLLDEQTNGCVILHPPALGCLIGRQILNDKTEPRERLCCCFAVSQALKTVTATTSMTPSGSGDSNVVEAPGQSLCNLCEAFETQVLNPLTQESEEVVVKHHGSFGLLVAAAAGGCRLCCALKEGYLRSNLYMESGLPKEQPDPAEVASLMDTTLLRLLRHDRSRHQLQHEEGRGGPRRQWTLRDMYGYVDGTQQVDAGFEVLLRYTDEAGERLTTTDFQPWLGHTHFEYRRSYVYPDIPGYGERQADFMLSTEQGMSTSPHDFQKDPTSQSDEYR